MKRFLALAVISVLSTAAFAQSAPMESVTVTGTGRATLTPDRFTFNVGVQTVAATVDDAVAANNRRVQSVIAALKRGGAADKDLQTSGFNIWPQQDYQQGKLPRILGYQVTNSITVRSEKIADAGKLLGIAISAGVNTSTGLNFEVSDPARGRDTGMRAAFEDARAKADVLARAANRTLGRALVIREGEQRGEPPPMPMTRAVAMEARVAQDVPVESGTQELTFTVTVSFELR